MCEEGKAIKVQVAFSQVKDYVIGLRKGRELLSEIVKILHLILVMPDINATSKRSFSVDRRMKTCLRSTMNQSRLNHLMALAVHKMTDKARSN
jgi:hypothetical protein